MLIFKIKTSLAVLILTHPSFEYKRFSGFVSLSGMEKIQGLIPDSH